MASKRRLRRKSCEGKRRYKTQEEAWRIVQRSNATNMAAYHCSFCGNWHVGHYRKPAVRAEFIAAFEA